MTRALVYVSKSACELEQELIDAAVAWRQFKGNAEDGAYPWVRLLSAMEQAIDAVIADREATQKSDEGGRMSCERCEGRWCGAECFAYKQGKVDGAQEKHAYLMQHFEAELKTATAAAHEAGRKEERADVIADLRAMPTREGDRELADYFENGEHQGAAKLARAKQ